MDNVTIVNNLPIGWKWTTIDSIGIVVSGGTLSTRQFEYWNGNIPWITPADLSNYDKKFIGNGRRNITQIGLDNSSAHLLPENSVMFSSRAPIGYIAITSNPMATNQGFKSILPSANMSYNYVYYYLSSVKNLVKIMRDVIDD